MNDVLRADRCISVNSLESRAPFGDLDFVRYVMSIDPELKLNKYGKGKYLLRHAFEVGDCLPESLLYREMFEKYYPEQSEMIVAFRMPNKAWKGCDVKDPSARVLSNYGAGGE